MSNTVTRNEFNALASAVSALVNALQGQPLPIFDAPAKTSARTREIEPIAEMAAKTGKSKGSKTLDDVVKTVTEAETRNRMKLPARMFGTASKCIVDGHTFEQCETDQNRSLPFSPEVFGAEAGDVITFTHEGKQGNKLVWDYTVEAGERPRKGKGKSKSAPAKSREEKPSRKADTKPAKSAGSSSKSSAIKSLIAEFAEKCIENNAAARYSRKHKLEEDDDKFFELPAFEGTQGDTDARSLLTYKQRGQFRKACKALGLDTATRVEMLNDAVYE